MHGYVYAVRLMPGGRNPRLGVALPPTLDDPTRTRASPAGAPSASSNCPAEYTNGPTPPARRAAASPQRRPLAGPPPPAPAPLAT